MNFLLDKQSPIPMYVQIAEELEHRVRRGDFPVGGAIPPERELTELFGVSRMTVRQSITKLVNEGLLFREKGRGTFVATPKVEQPLSGLTSFTEDMKARGLTPSSKLLTFEKKTPDADIAKELYLEQGDQVFFVERIRYADDKPMAIEKTFVPEKIFPSLTEQVIQGSLYSWIEQTIGMEISRATQRMEAALIGKEEAEFLEVPLSSAMLIIERVSYLADGSPFEVVRSTYRADRYKFTSEINR